VRVRLKLPRRKAPFVYPIPPAPRTAVLIPGFRSHGCVRVFAKGWCEEAANFAPQAIAGTLGQLEAIAASGSSLDSLSHAVVVLGRWEDARVSEADREMLWRRFRVPVFEQIVSRNGVLLAAECEAHHGLHIEADAARARGRETQRIDESKCACGRTTARIISLDEAAREGRLRGIATFAR
jgi:phenylacetate-coenzyme A ligase PaaK-like adenylate-forming protein